MTVDEADVANATRRTRPSLRRNAAALYLVHGANLALPLITVPYLARVLGPSAWGVVIAAQGLSAWIAVVGEYGFGLSATRAIAQETDRARIARIVGDVQGAKVLLAMLGALLALAFAVATPVFRGSEAFVFWAWLAGIGQGLLPLWYFQGVEAMARPALIYVAARSAGTVAVFLLVREPADAWMVLGTSALASIAGAGAAIALMYREVPALRPTARGALAALRSGGSMFFYRASVSLYTAANGLILSVFASAPEVALYGAAEKLTRAVKSLYLPVSQAMFPRMSYLGRADTAKAAGMASKSTVIFALLGITLGSMTFLAAPIVVRVVLGAQYAASAGPLQILSLSIPVVGVSTVLGTQWMLPLRMDRVFNAAILIGSVTNLVAASIMAPAYGAAGMAGAVVLAEAGVAAAMYAILRRHSVDPWSTAARLRDRAPGYEELSE